jgi:hypothetical protein
MTLGEFAERQILFVEKMAEDYRNLLKVKPDYDLEEGVRRKLAGPDRPELLRAVSANEIVIEVFSPGAFRKAVQG